MIYKSFSYLTSLILCGPVNPSTPNFGNINLTETMTNLIRNVCKNLYLHPKPLKVTFKSNSYLMPISCRGPVTLSIPNFPNINLTKTLTNLLVVWKMTEKGLNNFYLLPKVFHRSSKLNLYLMPISRRGPVNL